jgi:LPS export ABC transporter permease LptF/LPS export ABC transporter permease LptG
MRLLSRTLFREIFASALLGCVLFTSVLFLRGARPLFEFLVRNSGPAETVLYLFILVLPQALPYAIPLGVVVGVLITLSRKSADGEITAMRAAGIPGRRVAPPVLAFAFGAMCVAAASTLWLTPWSIEERYRVLNEIITGQLTADIQPRVFEERFPNTILHVSDVAAPTRWRRVFLADLSPSADRGDSPSITLASEAVAVADPEHNRVQLSLRNGNKYEVNRNIQDYQIQSFPEYDQALQAQRPPEVRASRPTMYLETKALFQAAYRNTGSDPLNVLEARIELHQRMALPFACLVLALAGIPLGVGSRRAGKSAAMAFTVVLAFAYYMGMITMISLARQGQLPASLAVWLPNIVFGLLGLILLVRLERPGNVDVFGAVVRVVGWIALVPKTGVSQIRDRISRIHMPRFALLPQVVDTYLTASFLFYFVLWLASFVLLTHVFTFFELLGDIIKNQIPLTRVFTYLFFLTPRLVYESTPVAVLTSVLVVFGVLTKNNEVTAFKACGVSVYRLTVPIFLTSLLLAGGLFAFNHYLVPEADRLQDAIRAEIKGRPPQTFLNPGQKWIYGAGDRIFYYRYFDPVQTMMVGVNVFEIDPAAFRLKRHIAAERARWEPSLQAWVFQNGWRRDMDGSKTEAFDDFAGQARTFSEIEETPDHFVKEAIQSQQMNYLELRAYIEELQQIGYNTIPLQVQFYKKFSVPLFTVILAMVSVPFAFQAGNRGTMAGIGVSFAIFIAYSSIGQLFEQVGNLNQLPPSIAAWSPDAVFALAGMYFLARVRT